VSDKLGSVIKAARLEKHLTQRQLAERLSITSHYLMSIENKKKIPSCDLLFYIIRELEISADTIFYPEYPHDNVMVGKLRILLSRCDEKDINVIIATLQSLLENKESDRG
jgi:transcriptional regulator with XRE-family HTH domain